MVAKSIVLPVLLACETLLVHGSTFSGMYGGYGGIGSAAVGVYQCGQVQCKTEIQCEGCDYPQPFVQQVSYSRSVLTRVEEFVQSVGQVAINVPGRMMLSAVSIPAGFVEMSMRTGTSLVSEINTAIESLNSFVSHQVVGRIAYDIVADLSDSLSVVRKLVGWCGSASSGTSVVPIPQDIVVRYQQSPVWNNQCQGAWPCTTLIPYTSSQGQQSQYSNKYGYSNQYNRGNTQIVNSNYDSGNMFGFGDTGTAANQYNYLTGAFPAGRSWSFNRGFGGARALVAGKKAKKSKRSRGSNH